MSSWIFRTHLRPISEAVLVRCEDCQTYCLLEGYYACYMLDDQPIGSRTRLRIRTGNVSSGAVFHQVVEPYSTPAPPETAASDPHTNPSVGCSPTPTGEPHPSHLHEDLDAGDFDDSDYSELISNTSSTDSTGYGNEPVAPEEVMRLNQPLSTWERIDFEDLLPRDLIQTISPDILSPTQLVYVFKCGECKEAVHHDDIFDTGSPHFEAMRNSGDFCESCLRLKDVFRLRAGYCNCRCQCDETDYSDDGSDEDLDYDSSDEDLEDIIGGLDPQTYEEIRLLFLAIDNVLNPDTLSDEDDISSSETEDDYVEVSTRAQYNFLSALSDAINEMMIREYR